ncbi:hypothetical protein ELH97_13360 [Rhizobium leguminosarum]|nr:hypothetical protein ELI05_13890 [Rhizobium leguminosarum]TAX92864.1 hypothetical protein ELH97_13360 [Rhizobium leguminosarum]
MAGNRHPRYLRFHAFQLNSTAGSWFQIIGRNRSTRPAEGVGRHPCSARPAALAAGTAGDASYWLESGLVRNGKTAYVGAIFDRSLDGKFRVSVVATGLEGSPLPASAPHAAVKRRQENGRGGFGIRAVRPIRAPCVLSDAQKTL